MSPLYVFVIFVFLTEKDSPPQERQKNLGRLITIVYPLYTTISFSMVSKVDELQIFSDYIRQNKMRISTKIKQTTKVNI